MINNSIFIKIQTACNKAQWSKEQVRLSTERQLLDLVEVESKDMPCLLNIKEYLLHKIQETEDNLLFERVKSLIESSGMNELINADVTMTKLDGKLFFSICPDGSPSKELIT